MLDWSFAKKQRKLEECSKSKIDLDSDALVRAHFVRALLCDQAASTRRPRTHTAVSVALTLSLTACSVALPVGDGGAAA
jgi:hypothetical protein